MEDGEAAVRGVEAAAHDEAMSRNHRPMALIDMCLESGALSAVDEADPGVRDAILGGARPPAEGEVDQDGTMMGILWSEADLERHKTNWIERWKIILEGGRVMLGLLMRMGLPLRSRSRRWSLRSMRMST